MITNMTMKATGHISAERFYGDFVKIDNSRWRVYHPTGHVDITSQGVQTWMYYVRDRLGSTRAVITEQGVPLQAMDYYPSGIPVETYTAGNAYNTTDRLHTGKEFHAFDGLSWHDNAARFHDTLFPRFTTVDPLAEKDPGTSPYAYCGNNPLRFIDPTGESTQVVQNKDGSYTIKSVNINDSDLGVYVVGTEDEKPRLIGYTATITSFYNTEKDKGAAVGSVINPNDKSGINFLKGIVSKDYTLREYAHLARKEKSLDFKYSNGDGSELSDKDKAGVIYNLQKSNKRILPRFYIYHTPSKTYVRYYPNTKVKMHWGKRIKIKR